MDTAATKKHNARRRKLLMNTEDRMRKIKGCSQEPEASDESTKPTVTEPITDRVTHNLSQSAGDSVRTCVTDDDHMSSTQITADHTSDPHLTHRASTDDRGVTSSHVTDYQDEATQGWILDHSLLRNNQGVGPGLESPSHSQPDSPAYSAADDYVPEDNSAQYTSSSHTDAIFGSNSYHSRSHIRSRAAANRCGTSERMGATVTEDDDDPPVDELLSPTQPMKSTVDETHQSLVTMRLMLHLMIGALVRVALNTHSHLIQTILYPFIALQIALIGYYRAADIPLTDKRGGVGGLWMIALSMAGVRTQILHTYGRILQVIVLIADNFAVLTFSFILTHVLTGSVD